MHTVCVGKAWGNAAMLLASGKKGFRHSLPHASIMTCPPRINRAQVPTRHQ
jgi:ATP-dependent Clp protease protease subunit